MPNGEPKSDTRQGSLIGQVSSISGKQTVRVTVERLAKVPRYGKYVRRRTKLAVHDPKDEAHLGDVVEIASCRPISRTKHYRLLRVIRRAGAVEAPSGG